MTDNNKSNPTNDDGIVEEADLEQIAKAGGKPPKAKRYRIRVDDQHYVIERSSMSGAEILKVANKTPPENFILTQKLRGGVIKTIDQSSVVDFTTPGIERFNTLPRQVQEG